jgi:cellulose synthase/poly-beta-1,6-N-acetylglucosamine synthase-like glycosyltransferase
MLHPQVRVDAHVVRDGMSEDDAPLVSVIIPAHNVSEFIGDTVRSVFAQQFRRFEVIVVDDGSTDALALDAALAPFREHIVVLTQRNEGPSAARNAGIAHARGEYVAFLDGDDLWKPHCLNDLVERALGDRSLAVLHGDAEIIGDPAQAGRTLAMHSATGAKPTFRNLVEEQYTITTSCSMIRRDWCLRVGAFDETLRRSEDYELWLRVAHAGGQFSGTAKVLGQYRRRASSASADPTLMIEAKLAVMDKCERTLSLNSVERQAITSARNRQLAERALWSGKRAFASGDFPEARRNFREANIFLRSSKIAAVVFGLSFVPRTLGRLHEWRTGRS